MQTPSLPEQAIAALEQAMGTIAALVDQQVIPALTPEKPTREQECLFAIHDRLETVMDEVNGLEAVRCRKAGLPSRFRLELNPAQHVA